MKRLLLASVAAVMFVPGGGVWAADMAVKAPPAPYVAPTFNWTGFYIGGNVGGGWLTAPVTDNFTGVNVGTPSQGAFIGGGQVGYNWQFSPYGVFGVEGFFDGVADNNNNNSITFLGLDGHTFQASASTNWVATAAARLGVTSPVWDRWLLYVKGGGGWIQTQGSLGDLTTGASISNSQTHGGWVFGVGLEYAFAPNWTAKVEWQYLGLEDFSVGPGIVGDAIRIENGSVNTLTFGINYLFNYGYGAPAPVVSRY
jgi:outer membrane immunogenic protein